MLVSKARPLMRFGCPQARTGAARLFEFRGHHRLALEDFDHGYVLQRLGHVSLPAVPRKSRSAGRPLEELLTCSIRLRDLSLATAMPKGFEHAGGSP
jgi:hypothetical protein